MAGISTMTRPRVDTRRVRQHFSGHACEYERYAIVQKRVVAALLHMLGRHPSSSGPVLEVGSGTGELSRRFREAYPGVPLTLSDIAHGMTCCAAGSVAKVTAVDADAQDLPFRSAHFGLVISSSVYQWVNDLNRAFAESARVLAPGGRFAFALFGGNTLCELRDCHGRALAEGGRPGGSHMQAFPSVEEVRDALPGAGLEILELRSFDEVEHHPDVPSLLRSLKRIGAQNASSSRPSGLASRRVMHRMAQLYREIHGSGGTIPATYEVICAFGRKSG